MNILSELKILFKSLRNWALLLVLGTIFFFAFGLGTVEIRGKETVFPVPKSESLSAELLRHIVEEIVPEGVPLMVTGPLTAFIAQMKLAFLLSFVSTFPFLLYAVLSYLKPALYARERRLIYMILTPAVLLFIVGNFFAYKYILPATFSILYGYAVPINAMTFVSVGEFVGLSFALMLICGICFMLPVAMVLLSAVGAVDPRAWFVQWRYALIIFLIVSAIITPDGSGVTMVLLAAPVSALYGVGALISARIQKAQQHSTEVVPHN